MVEDGGLTHILQEEAENLIDCNWHHSCLSEGEVVGSLALAHVDLKSGADNSMIVLQKAAYRPGRWAVDDSAGRVGSSRRVVDSTGMAFDLLASVLPGLVPHDWGLFKLRFWSEVQETYAGNASGLYALLYAIFTAHAHVVSELERFCGRSCLATESQ